MSKIWVGHHRDIRHDDEAKKALEQVNDIKYWDNESGITAVPEERWKAAQEFELTYWSDHSYAESDRHNEHEIGFNHYEKAPHNLGDAIEIGCGPFSQMSTILRGRNCRSVTLSDPLLESYLKLPNCKYKDGTIVGRRAILIPSRGEDLTYINSFDTVVCINVVEHVMDATKILNNIYNMLRPNGCLIFHERNQDHIDINSIYDVGHPIRLKSKVINEFLSKFKERYKNGEYYIVNKT